MNNQDNNIEQKKITIVDLDNRYLLIKKAVERIQKDKL